MCVWLYCSMRWFLQVFPPLWRRLFNTPLSLIREGCCAKRVLPRGCSRVTPQDITKGIWRTRRGKVFIQLPGMEQEARSAESMGRAQGEAWFEGQSLLEKKSKNVSRMGVLASRVDHMALAT